MSNKYHSKTCYACDAKAETGEHAPPQCFFPHATKDKLPKSVDYKKGLIKEPSCFIHNQAKSADDYFFKHVIYSLNQLDSPLVKFVRTGSIQKEFDNNQTNRIRKLFGDKINFNNQIATTIDLDKFQKYVVDMARVIYHKEHAGNKKIKEDEHPASTFQLITDFLLTLDAKQNEEIRFVLNGLIEKMADVDFSCHCHNPDVFLFKIKEDQNNLSIHMQFYKRLNIVLVKKLSG